MPGLKGSRASGVPVAGGGGPPDAHKDTHKLGGSDAFAATDLLNALIRRIRESGGADLLVGAVADGEFLKRSGTALIGAAVGGPPGTWTQLGKGPTSVADNTDITVLADETLSAGEIPHFMAVMKTTPTGDQQAEFARTSTAGASDASRFTLVKKTNGNVDFRIRHRDGGARDFDWVVNKVLPA